MAAHWATVLKVPQPSKKQRSLLQLLKYVSLTIAKTSFGYATLLEKV